SSTVASICSCTAPSPAQPVAMCLLLMGCTRYRGGLPAWQARAGGPGGVEFTFACEHPAHAHALPVITHPAPLRAGAGDQPARVPRPGGGSAAIPARADAGAGLRST